MKPILALATCAFALMLPSLGSASILYSSLPDHDVSSPNIYGTFTDSGEFHIGADSILTGATVALWMNPGYPPSSLDWSIQSTATGGTVFGSGTGATLTNEGPSPVRVIGDTHYDLYYSTFTLPPSMGVLAAGDYWLHLSNCGTDGLTDGCGWGLSYEQPGPDRQFLGDSPGTDIGKFAFSIQGNSATPEPTTWLMFAPALAGFVTVIRRRA